MNFYLVVAWGLFCGIALLVLYAFRRRPGAIEIIKALHLWWVPEPDPRILLLWGWGAIGMALFALIWAVLE